MSDAYQRMNKQFYREVDKNLTLAYGSLALALRRYWGFGQKRISDVLSEIMGEWTEENQYHDNYSMLKMLEDETGIELQLDGVSWHSIDFLNGTTRTTDRVDRMSTPEYLYMMHRKIKWQPMQFTSSILIAMYRKHGFSSKRDQDLMNQMFDIQQEFGSKPQKIINAVKQECRLDLWTSRKREPKETAQGGGI